MSSLNITNQPLYHTSLPAQSYVLSVTPISNLYATAASSPLNHLHLFSKATFQRVGVLKGHEHATTQLCTVHGLGSSTREMLLSSGKDGRVLAWDVRSGAPSIRMENFDTLRPLLCCDASDDGLLIAAGTELQNEDAFIMYWDPRNPDAPLRSHGSTHSNDITSVHFLKNGALSSNKVLLSTSSDGLVSTSNALQADEDEAVLHVGNWGCSIAQGGWINDSREAQIWTASDMETFSCWSSELDQLSGVDIRDSSLHDCGHTWVTDYLIKGHSTWKAANGLAVFVGSNEGDVALISSKDLSKSTAPWTMHSVWAGGHAGVIRSLHWDEEHDVLVTGGEDSKIIAWRIQDLRSDVASTSKELEDSMDVEEPNLKREWHDTEDPSTPGNKRARR